jgi:aminopeptidase N
MVLLSPLQTPWPATKSSSGVPVRMLMIPSAAPPATTALTLAVGAAAIDAYEHLLQVPYPLPKLDLIAVPANHFGGFEAWGAIEFMGKLITPPADDAASVLTMCWLVSHVSHVACLVPH